MDNVLFPTSLSLFLSWLLTLELKKDVIKIKLLLQLNAHLAKIGTELPVSVTQD